MNEHDPAHNCTRYSVKDLARLLDEDPSSRKRQRLQQHLQTCPSCRQRLHELTAMRAVLRSAPRVALPRSFTLSTQDVPQRRHVLWYPVLRLATTVAATMVLLLLVGGLLQPTLWREATPTPRVVEAKPTPLVAPTPRPVAIAPASTSRPRPTQPGAGPAVSAVPTALNPDIPVLPAYPSPVKAGPRIHATVSRPVGGGTTTKAEPPRTSAVWPALHLGGLLLLGVLAGLTWLAYRHERAFL